MSNYNHDVYFFNFVFQAKKDDVKVNIGYFFSNLCALSL